MGVAQPAARKLKTSAQQSKPKRNSAHPGFFSVAMGILNHSAVTTAQPAPRVTS
jgi:hypothetical protein